MSIVSVVVPNYNGMQYVKTCMDSLMKQTLSDVEILFVDNGSDDGSREYVDLHYPTVRVITFSENMGFCKAVNEGIRASTSDYVVLLNNDTEAEPDFLKELYLGIRKKNKAFSAAAMMLQFHNRELIDDAGDFYSALGWAFARGKGKPAHLYGEEKKIFSACGGAAIYRKQIFEEIGYFDEEHFAYLEDADIGYRAQIVGYENWYLPKARVFHVGSGTSGSRYNQFKIRYSSRNNVYMICKNMPIGQIVLNLPLLVLGFGIKLLFFMAEGYGGEYMAGIKNGFTICKNSKKVPFRWKNMGNYVNIQIQLWRNLVRRFE